MQKQTTRTYSEKQKSATLDVFIQYLIVRGNL